MCDKRSKKLLTSRLNREYRHPDEDMTRQWKTAAMTNG